jgi:hypothetical protein
VVRSLPLPAGDERVLTIGINGGQPIDNFR